MKKGILFVISGPAGTGKGTVIKHLLDTGEFFYSVSATTRTPRPGETDGVNYYFISREEFLRKIERGDMLEHAEYVGNFYGTPKDAVEKALNSGKNVILEIETAGALQIREKMPEAVLILILPPDLDTLRARLTGRGTESAEVIDQRMEKAKKELSLFPKYDYAVVNENDRAEEAAEKIYGICKAEHLKTARNIELENNFKI